MASLSETGDYRYQAFISYCHQDEKWGIWLHRALEGYRVPRYLVGKKTADTLIPRRLTPIFRDRDELPTATDLGKVVNEALQRSACLIVICSPHAARSRWVNQEILSFKRWGRSDRILCLIVEGEPNAADKPELEAEECFPEALRYVLGPDGALTDQCTEPIAADVRPQGDSKATAKLKIISGLLGVGLDALVQRDAQRRHRRMLGLTMASVTGMLVLAILSIVAIDARNSEQLRRSEAEDLIEFMLGDLRNRLEAVGRLDVLDSVGEKAIEYYSKSDLSEHTNSSLGRRARALHLLGEMDDLRGDIDAARTAFEEAYESTGELVRRSPTNGELVFDHAQSVFWVGYLDWRLGSYAEAESSFIEYLSLANRLGELDSDNIDWLVESGHANLNLGVYTLETGASSSAIQYFQEALSVFQQALEKDPDSSEWPLLVTQAHAWLADAYENDGSLARARDERFAEATIYQQILSGDPDNQEIRLTLIISYRSRANISMQQGDVGTAIEDLLEAKRYGDDLRALDPENTLTAQVTASIYANLGEALAFDGNAAEPAALLEQADNIASQLIQIDQDVLEWQLLWHRIQLQRNKFLLRNSQRRPVTVIGQLLGATEQLSELASESPEVTEIRHLLAETHFIIGEAHRMVGSPAQAAEHAASTIQELSTMEAELPPRMVALLSLAYGAVGDTSRAARLAAELENINFKHPEYLLRED